MIPLAEALNFGDAMAPDRGLGWGGGENAEQVGAKDETMAVMESPMSIRIAVAVADFIFIIIMVHSESIHTPHHIQSLSTHLATTTVDRHSERISLHSSGRQASPNYWLQESR